MDHFFSDNNQDIEEKIDLDTLYSKKREIEELRMGIYKKILNRVHLKIKTVAKQRNSEPYLFYVVPEFVFGIPKYDVRTCISFIMEKLEENGFQIKYTHPNLLFISWMHYIPSYQREQIKKQTGKNIDGFGNIIKSNKLKNIKKPENVNDLLLNSRNTVEMKTPRKKNKEYKDISTYKNTGIYDIDLISKLKNKLE